MEVLVEIMLVFELVYRVGDYTFSDKVVVEYLESDLEESALLVRDQVVIILYIYLKLLRYQIHEFIFGLGYIKYYRTIRGDLLYFLSIFSLSSKPRKYF